MQNVQPNLREVRAAERKNYRDGIQKWFDNAKRTQEELVILSYIAQQVNLNIPGDSAEGVAFAVTLVLLNRLKIDYTLKSFTDKSKDFSNKSGYNQRYHDMGVIQYFRNAAEFILWGTAWDPALPAAVHLRGDTILNIEKEVFFNLKGVAAEKFQAEAAAAAQGQDPQVPLRRYVLYMLKQIWAEKGLLEAAKYAFKANIPGFTGVAETTAGTVELFPQIGGPGFNNDVGMRRKSWIAMEILYILWLDLEQNIFKT